MARGLQSLELFPPESVEASHIDQQPARGKRQLWVAVCLPSIAFECLGLAELDSPTVVVEAEHGQQSVAAANQTAAQAGIVAGMKLSTAIALASSLRIVERVPARERQCLESLAGWATTLTSMVSIEPPESVLLEVAGSLKLFGSLDVIKNKLHAELSQRFHGFRSCGAPTPTAALWFARAAQADVLQWRELPGRLAALPLSVTRWPIEVMALLHDLGVRTIGDCVRLPRDGFARRVGRSQLLELDRAFGRQVDLRVEFGAPESWSSRVELYEESVDSGVFLQAVEQLLDELTAELRKRQAAIGSFELYFEHLHRPATVESFDLREPTHHRGRLLRLIEDRLERSLLPVPAVALRMASGVFQPHEQRDGDLFEPEPLEERAQVLLDRLQERFGTAAVYGLCTIAEHRPEKAWAKRLGAHVRGMPQGSFEQQESRPLWLLPEPVAVEARRGALKLLSGPERIESGWWDSQDVARDYYTAENGHGQRLWVFRDRRTRCWFLHGLFG